MLGNTREDSWRAQTLVSLSTGNALSWDAVKSAEEAYEVTAPCEAEPTSRAYFAITPRS